MNMVFALYLQHPDVQAFTLQPRHLERLRMAFPHAAVLSCADEATFLAALPDVTHALTWRFRNAWLDRARRLQHIATPAAGHDWIEPSPAPNLRVTFGAFHGPLITQTVLAQLLAFNRGLLVAERLACHGDAWPRASLTPHLHDVRNTHAVILGFGHIGQAIGQLLKPFGIRVTALRRDTSQPPPAWFAHNDRVLPVAQIDAALPDADHLICALPATPETTHLLDAARLARLPGRAALYNIGRGNVVDETALAKCLCDGHLRGALLDVFQSEPLPPDSPLRAAPNFFLLPHASAIAPNYLDLWLDELLPQLRA